MMYRSPSHFQHLLNHPSLHQPLLLTRVNSQAFTRNRFTRVIGDRPEKADKKLVDYIPLK